MSGRHRELGRERDVTKLRILDPKCVCLHLQNVTLRRVIATDNLDQPTFSGAEDELIISATEIAWSSEVHRNLGHVCVP